MTWGRGSTRAWRTLRAQVLTEEPTCYLHYPGCTGTSTQADHVTPRAEGGTDNRHNLHGACKHCHDIKSRAEAARGRQRRNPKRKLEPHPGLVTNHNKGEGVPHPTPTGPRGV